MNQEVGTSQKLSKASIALGIYFLLLPTDCFRIGAVGSLLKVYAFVPIAFLFLSGGMRRLILDRLLSRLLLFLLIAALSALWSMDFDVTVSSVRSLALNILFAVLMAGTYQYTEKEAGFLLKCLVASSWITVIGMLLFGSSSELGRLTLVIGDSEQDPNYVTGYIVFAFAYHFTAFLKQRKFLHLFPTAAIMIVIILTGSRGDWPPIWHAPSLRWSMAYSPVSTRSVWRCSRPPRLSWRILCSAPPCRWSASPFPPDSACSICLITERRAGARSGFIC